MIPILINTLILIPVLYLCTPKAKRNAEGAMMERLFWSLFLGGVIALGQGVGATKPPPPSADPRLERYHPLR